MGLDGLISWARSLVARAGVVVALAASAALGGCYDNDMIIELRSDGTVELINVVRFDREMRDIFAAAESYGALDPAAGAFLENGVCRALETLAAMNPANPLKLAVSEGLQATEKGEQYVCRFTIDGGPVEAIPERLAALPPEAGLAAIQLTELGERKFRLVIDAEAIPDLADVRQLAQLRMMLMLRRRPGQPMPTTEQMAAFYASYKKATQAFADILFRDRTMQLRIRAPKISESNLPLTGNELVVRSTVAEFTAFSLDRDARKGKRIDVVITY